MLHRHDYTATDGHSLGVDTVIVLPLPIFCQNDGVAPSHGRHRYSTLPLSATGGHSLGIDTGILLYVAVIFCRTVAPQSYPGGRGRRVLAGVDDRVQAGGAGRARPPGG